MKEHEFQAQIARLEKQFGKYGTERCMLLWREVSEFSNAWFTRVIDQFIGHQRQAPLLADFQEEISKQREYLWQQEKKEHAKDAKDFWEGTYHNDEIKDICQKIRLRIEGRMKDEDWEQFVKMLNYAAGRKTG